MMNNWMESEVLSQVGYVLLHSVWQFLLIAAAFGVISQLLKHSPVSAYRFACAGLLLMVACPIMTWWSLSKGASWHGESWPAFFNFSERFPSLLPWLSLSWIVGTIVFAVRPVVGCWGQVCLAGQPSLDIPDSLVAQFQAAIKRMEIARNVRLKLVDQNIGPMVAGWLRPIVVVPMSVLSNLSPQEIELLLTHELAHVQRNDCWVNAIQVIVETLFFYHPAVWWMSRQIRISREHCCDDLAAPDQPSRLVFGKALLALEQNRSLQGSLSLAASDGDLLRRIRRLSKVQVGQVPSIALRPAACGLIAAGVLTATLWMTPASRSTRFVLEKAQPNARVKRQLPSVAQFETNENDTTAPGETLHGNHRWNITLEECVAIAIQNQNTVIATVTNDSAKEEDQIGTVNPVKLWSLDENTSIIDFECQIRNLVRDIEVAYWDLNASYQKISTLVDQRNEVTAAAQHVLGHLEMGISTQQELDKAIRQQNQLQSKLSRALHGSSAPGEDRLGVFGRERSLRKLLGLPPTDGRLVYPTDKPSKMQFQFDWDDIVKTTLKRSPELRRKRMHIDAQQKEHDASLQDLDPEVDLEPLYRWVGAGDKLGVSKPDLDRTFPSPNMKAVAERTKDTDKPNVVRLELTPPPLGVRRELAHLRNMKLRLTRDQGYLTEAERMLVSQVSEAVAKCMSHYQLMGTHEQRVAASEHEVKARLEEFRGGRSPVNVVLQSQQRKADAQISYYRDLAEYNKALGFVDYLRGLTLAKKNIVLASTKP